MALTIKTLFWMGDGRIIQVTGDSSYPSGGYPLTKSVLGMKIIKAVEPQGPAISSAAALALIMGWDPFVVGSEVLRLFWSAAAGAPFPEVTATTNVGLYIGRLRVYGA